MCVGAVGQGLWRASLQEGSWAPVISKETPPRETTWSGQVAPGEGTMMVSWPADSLLREMLRDEVSRPTQRPRQQLRGTVQGTPLPLVPLDSAGARWVGGDQVGLRQSAGTPSSLRRLTREDRGLTSDKGLDGPLLTVNPSLAMRSRAGEEHPWDRVQPGGEGTECHLLPLPRSSHKPVPGSGVRWRMNAEARRGPSVAGTLFSLAERNSDPGDTAGEP